MKYAKLSRITFFYWLQHGVGLFELPLPLPPKSNTINSPWKSSKTRQFRNEKCLQALQKIHSISSFKIWFLVKMKHFRVIWEPDSKRTGYLTRYLHFPWIQSQLAKHGIYKDSNFQTLQSTFSPNCRELCMDTSATVPGNFAAAFSFGSVCRDFECVLREFVNCNFPYEHCRQLFKGWLSYRWQYFDLKWGKSKPFSVLHINWWIFKSKYNIKSILWDGDAWWGSFGCFERHLVADGVSKTE